MKSIFVLFCALGAVGSCTSPSGVRYIHPADDFHPIEIVPQKEDESKKKKPSVHVEFAERGDDEG